MATDNANSGGILKWRFLLNVLEISWEIIDFTYYQIICAIFKLTIVNWISNHKNDEYG
jgi:hypothetical protein